MNTAFRLLNKKLAEAGGVTYGVNFPATTNDYIWHPSQIASYESIDWIIDMDVELKSPLPATGQQDLFSVGNNFRHYIDNTGRLVFVSSNVAYGPSTNPLPLDVKFNLRMERSGTVYRIYVNNSLFHTFGIPTTAKFYLKVVGGNTSAVRPLFGKIYTLKVCTPSAPSQPAYVLH